MECKVHKLNYWQDVAVTKMSETTALKLDVHKFLL